MKQREWISIAAAIVVVVLVALGGWYALTRHAAPASAPATNPSGSAATTTGAAAQGATGGVAPSARAAAGASSQRHPGALPPAAAVAATGAALARVSDLPAGTLSRVEATLFPAGARYVVTMRPYGIGPSTALGPTLALKIDSARALGAASDANKLVGLNVIARVPVAGTRVYVKGGTYTTTLSFVSTSQGLMPAIAMPLPASAQGQGSPSKK